MAYDDDNPYKSWASDPDNSDRTEAPVSSRNNGGESQGAATPGQLGSPWGTTSTATVLPSTLEAGDPQYNARQQEFESSANWDWIRNNLQDAAAREGVKYDESDLMGIVRNAGYDQQHLGDAGLYNSRLQQYYQNVLENYDQRSNNVPGGGNDETGQPRQQSRSSSSFSNSSPTFDDPTQRLLEDYGLDRFQSLQNPDPNSGQALYESELKALVDKLRGPVYSPAEEAAIQAKAYDNIYRERDSAIANFKQQMSRLGHGAQSGTVAAGVAEIERQFEGVRAQADNDFAIKAIELRRVSDQQLTNLLGTLAGAEEGRLASALQYGQIPYALSNDAFQRNLQASGMGGNPNQLLQSVMGVANQVAANNAVGAQQQQTTMANLLEFLAGL